MRLNMAFQLPRGFLGEVDGGFLIMGEVSVVQQREEAFDMQIAVKHHEGVGGDIIEIVEVPELLQGQFRNHVRQTA